ncbi:glycosyltransferase family 2 protein [Providencia rettgeri]
MKNFNDNIGVSIVMPMYNGENFLEKAISSVVKQTFKNWELIIIDDHSDDNSYSIAKNYISENIKLLKTKNSRSGAAKARNIGILEAKKRFIAFLDCDDYWDSNKLEKQLNLLIKEKAHFCYSAYNIFDNESGKIIGSFHPKNNINYYSLLKGCDIGCLTVVYDTAYLGKCYFPETVKEDYALWLAIAKIKNIKFVFCSDTLANYRISSNSISSNKWKEIKRQFFIYNEIENLGFINSSRYLASYIFYGIKKHYLSYRGNKN